MKISIGTYSLFWEMPDRNPEPLSIAGMIDRASQLDCEVFQICDDPRIEDLDAAGLRELRERAEALGLTLELGTRTIDQWPPVPLPRHRHSPRRPHAALDDPDEGDRRRP